MLDVITRLAPDLLDYHEGWALQRELHTAVVAGAEGSLVLCEHEPVFTAGKRTVADERPTDGTPVVDVDRGGKITWHGPGSSPGTRSCGCANPWTSSPSCATSRR